MAQDGRAPFSSVSTPTPPTDADTEQRTMSESVKRRGTEGRVGDWRLPRGKFMESFHKPGAEDRFCELAEANPFVRDDRITFDEESHTYTIDGEHVVRCSVTRLVHHFVKAFDADKAILMMKNNRKRPWVERQREEFTIDGVPMTNEQIKALWSANGNEQSSRGTLMHWHVEAELNHTRPDEPHSPEFQQFLVFKSEIMDARGWKPLRTELSMFHCGLGVAGQADCICRDPAGDVVILDWKRCRSIERENSFAKMRSPFEHLDDCNFNHYSLQLNVYRLMLEQEYGLRVSDMMLGVFHPDQKEFSAVPIPRLDREMELLYRWAREHMGAQPPQRLVACLGEEDGVPFKCSLCHAVTRNGDDGETNRESVVKSDEDGSLGRGPFLDRRPLRFDCGHVCHRRCALRWLERNETCPSCDRVVSVLEAEECPFVARELPQHSRNPGVRSSRGAQTQRPRRTQQTVTAFPASACEVVAAEVA
jgi:hypothetical protein